MVAPVKEKVEGYWYSEREPQYPKPEPGVLSEKQANLILSVLTDCEQEAKAVYFRGWSTCRVCGRKNGSAEYHFKGWAWPEGYSHYVKDHLVRPSDEFLNFLKSQA